MMKPFEYDQIYELVLRRGYPSITAFAASDPCLSWYYLAEKLDPELAAVQVQAAMRQEAEVAGNVQEYALSSLIRYLHEHLQNGWIEDETNFEAAFCYGDWSASLGPELEDFAERAWDVLKSLNPPAGWLPKNVDDPYLVAAFVRARPRL